MLTEHELSTDMSINHYLLVTPVVSLGEHYKLKWVTQTIGLKISKCSALAQFCCTQPIGFVNTQHFGLVHFQSLKSRILALVTQCHFALRLESSSKWEKNGRPAPGNYIPGHSSHLGKPVCA